MHRLIKPWFGGFLVMMASCDDGEAAMTQAVLFSAIEGQVVKDGQPVAGATLVRDWEFAADKVVGHDETVTGAGGRFRFGPVIHAYQPPRMLAQQPIVDQRIHVTVDGRNWPVWTASKHDLEAGTEAKMGFVPPSDVAVPLQVTIDLDSPRALRGRVIGHTLFPGQP